MSKVRKTLYITEDIAERLRREAFELRMSQSVLVENALCRWFAEEAGDETTDDCRRGHDCS